MKKVILTIVAVLAVLCTVSCQKTDKCKCTTVITTGDNKSESTVEVDMPEKGCASLNSSASVAGITTKVTCKNAY